ncbi:MAG: M28 family peptidase [Planctomycetota bacterium]
MNRLTTKTLGAALAVAFAPTWAVAQDESSAAMADSETSMIPAPVPEGAPTGTSAIDRVDLRRHAFYLASDGLEGRHTGSRGQEMAANYIASQFAALGLEPMGDESVNGRSFVQQWPVVKTYLPEGRSHVSFAGTRHETGFGILQGSEAEDLEVSGPLVFGGRPARDEIEDLPEGAIVLLALDDKKPSRMGGVEAQFMMQFTRMRRVATGARKALSAGASAVLIGLEEGAAGVSDLINYTGLVPNKPLLKYGSDAGQMDMLTRMVQGDAPIVFVSEAMTSALRGQLEAAGEAGLLVDLAIDVETDENAFASNVCAVLPGSDPELRDQAIVISAHMDHMGTRLDGDVFNGADDNASGSSCLLELAEAFARGERPKRSVVFLSVSGEELGLWGSDYYATHPTWPLADIVANINIDMIGRNAELSGPDEISITPSHLHRKFSSIGRTAAGLAEDFGLGLVSGDVYYERSDHYNFAERGVPVVFFCDGEHEDYHQVTDTADKLNYDKVERVARLAFWTGTTIANDLGRPSEIGRQKGWHQDDDR